MSMRLFSPTITSATFRYTRSTAADLNTAPPLRSDLAESSALLDSTGTPGNIVPELNREYLAAHRWHMPFKPHSIDYDGISGPPSLYGGGDCALGWA
jgi:hypothetical protein